MSNKKQTAVEWLIEELETTEFYTEESKHNVYEQAKAMDEKQTIDFHIEVMKEGLLNEGESKWEEGYLPKIKKQAEEYYKKNYEHTTK